MSVELSSACSSAPRHYKTWGKIRRLAGTAVEALLLFMAVGVLLQNFFLRGQIRQLRETQSTMVPRETYLQAISANTPKVEVGRRIQSVQGVTLDGKFREVLTATGQTQGTVVISFSPGCIHCVRSQDGWTLLEAALRARGWQVLWVSRDPPKFTRPYCISHGIDSSNVLADPTNRTYLQLALESVPNLIAIDSRGIVAQVWHGELAGSWEKVFAYFHLSLPPTLASKGGTQAP